VPSPGLLRGLAHTCAKARDFRYRFPRKLEAGLPTIEANLAKIIKDPYSLSPTGCPNVLTPFPEGISVVGPSKIECPQGSDFKKLTLPFTSQPQEALPPPSILYVPFPANASVLELAPLIAALCGFQGATFSNNRGAIRYGDYRGREVLPPSTQAFAVFTHFLSSSFASKLSFFFLQAPILISLPKRTFRTVVTQPLYCFLQFLSCCPAYPLYSVVFTKSSRTTRFSLSHPFVRSTHSPLFETTTP